MSTHADKVLRIFIEGQVVSISHAQIDRGEGGGGLIMQKKHQTSAMDMAAVSKSIGEAPSECRRKYK